MTASNTDLLSNSSETADCWYLSGPTASGKTHVALKLAELLNAEIISLDSMAIYRGMNIGTAKPTDAEREVVPHHLIDIVDPDEMFSISDYVDAAQQCVREIRERGREPLFVGGTPLYLKALLRGIFVGPPADLEFRKQVEAEVERVGVEALHQRLRQIDPLSAARLHPNDVRRMVRALEVYKVTGRPISHMQLQFDQGRPAEACRVFVLDWPRSELHRRIDRRVDQMFELGLIEEVRALLDQYGTLSKTASQAVGYRQVINFLHGRLDKEQTIEGTKARTRQFAKRQVTWFRSLSECRWVERKSEVQPNVIAEQIVSAVERP